ncbi:MAG: mandelate racemase/muconate lactonizing enzyme family protein, partial [Acidimicrobiia bacterium]
MKIVDVETFVVANPPPSFGGRYFTFVKLTDSEGVIGYGEAYAGTFHPDVVTRMILDVAERHLLGHDPFDIESFWRRAYGRGYTLRPDLTLMGVVSALEMACWDIMGKTLDRPVYKLLGGQLHESLRTYTYLYPEPGDDSNVYEDPVLAARRAAEYVDRGFTAVKFDPAGPYTVMGGHQPSQRRIELSVEFARQIRDAVGSGADLLVGTHGQF